MSSLKNATPQKVNITLTWLDAEGILFKAPDPQLAADEMYRNCQDEISADLLSGKPFGFVNSKFIFPLESTGLPGEPQAFEPQLLGFWMVEMPPEHMPWIVIEASTTLSNEDGEASRRSVKGSIKTKPFNLRESLFGLKNALMRTFVEESFQKHVDDNDGDPLVYRVISKRIIDDDISTVSNQNGNIEVVCDFGIKGTNLFDRRTFTFIPGTSEDELETFLLNTLQDAYANYLYKLNEVQLSGEDDGRNLYITNASIGFAPPSESVN